jgi:hypothetical protein
LLCTLNLFFSLSPLPLLLAFSQDPSGTKDVKSFSFDYSYWSHDGFEVDEHGVFHATDNK